MMHITLLTTSVTIASTVPTAHPTARSLAPIRSPGLTAHSATTNRLAATSTNTFATRAVCAVLVHSATGRVFTRHAGTA